MSLFPLPKPRRSRVLRVALFVTCLAVLAFACSRDKSTGPIGGAPLDDLPQISADLLALSTEVQGAGVCLHWIWSDRNPYPAIEIERRVESRNQHGVIAGPFQYPVTGCIDADVSLSETYAYRARCYDAQQAAVAVSPWVSVEIGADPLFTVNAGKGIAGASPVQADLLATGADAMRIAWSADPSQESWQALHRSFPLEPAGNGPHTVSCQVRYPDGTTSAAVTVAFVLDASPPVPSFTLEVFPYTRSVRVDASASGDQDDVCPADELDFRWSWGDGHESARGAETTAVHTYGEPGRRAITLTLTDWAGHAAQLTQEADLSNRPPSAPQQQVPEDGALEISRLPLFQWSGSTDPERDPVTYTLYLGTTEPLPVAVTELATASWSPDDPLEAEMSYRWQVEAVDAWGDRTLSAAATFQTAANSAPAIADDPYPENRQERVSAWPRLSWSACIDPEGGGVFYDLYFGAALPPELVAEGLQEPSYQLDPLLFGTTYFWRVVARDAEGAESSSRTWRFKTGLAPSVPLVALGRGAFAMGNAAASAAVGNGPHAVELSRALWLGSHEVTNAQYVEMLMRALARRLVAYAGGLVVGHGQVLVDPGTPGCRLEWRGQGFGVTPGYEQHPVVGVTWCGAAAFCDWMNDCEGLPPSYADADDGSGAWELEAGSPSATTGYRLPTEAEWEYATQCAGARAYPWGDDAPTCSLANLGGCQGAPVAVGSFAAAPQLGGGGFFDLAGNVSEWCHDWWQDDLGATGQIDPAGPSTGSRKVLRGGGFGDAGDALRCSWRASQDPVGASGTTGFRVARTAGY